MLWVVFVVTPIVAALAIALMKRVPKHLWIAGFLLLAVLECALMGKASPSWEAKHVAASWALGNFFPWGTVGFYLWLTPYPRQAVLVAIGLPVVYVVALILGLVVGDASGLVPQ